MKLIIRKKGGPGSGFSGHAGRPGKIGGSAPEGVSSGNIRSHISEYLGSEEASRLTEREVVDYERGLLAMDDLANKYGWEHYANKRLSEMTSDEKFSLQLYFPTTKHAAIVEPRTEAERPYFEALYNQGLIGQTIGGYRITSLGRAVHTQLHK